MHGQNQQAPLPQHNSGFMSMPLNLGGTLRIPNSPPPPRPRYSLESGRSQDQGPTLLHTYPLHPNPGFSQQKYNYQNHHQYQYQPQFGMGLGNSRSGLGGGPQVPMYSLVPPAGFDYRYHAQTERNVVGVGGGGPPVPPQYTNPFNYNYAFPMNPSSSPPNYTLPLPTYPNPFQLTPPFQFHVDCGPSQARSNPAELNNNDISQPQPSTSTSCQPLWPPPISPSQQTGFPASSIYGGGQGQEESQVSPEFGLSIAARPKQENVKTEPRTAEPVKKPNAQTKILVGKRRGGSKILPTGVIKRSKQEGTAAEEAQGNSETEKKWSRYMIEVQHYRNQTCSDEKQVRSLVK